MKMAADLNVLARLIDPNPIFRFEDLVEAYAIRKDGVTETHVRTIDGWTAMHVDTGFSFYYDPTGKCTCMVDHR